MSSHETIFALRDRCTAASQDDGPDQGALTEEHPAQALLADQRVQVEAFCRTPAMRASTSMTAVVLCDLPGECRHEPCGR